jgi:peptidoglycan/LPS O-acetylase OafA/YrhL
MQEKFVDTKLLNSKPHFEILDGLRGLAALIIVIFHFMEIIFPDFNNNLISHGYLAVDFFFCLSGFVIAYAYDSRIADMGLKTFIKVRLIRLQPLVIIGSVLGLLTFIFDPFNNLYATYGFKETALLFITSVFMIPYPVMPERFFNLFSFNAPSWSLFWEYFANIIYATILFKATRKVLTSLVILGALALFYIAWNYGNLLGGWSGSTFFHGLARISFSFSIGMLIYRSNWIIKNNLGLLGLSGLLLLVFFIPHFESYNYFIEPILVVFYLPVIVSLGAGASLTKNQNKINKFSGDISYPLYMVHYPFIWIFLSYVTEKEPSKSELWWVIPIAVFLLICFAYLVSKYIDSPIRRYFTNKIKASANH